MVSREEKYKAKNFIDTAVSRGGDATTGWIVSGVKAMGVTAGQMAWVLVPLALLWGWVGWFLARQEEKLKGEREGARQATAPTALRAKKSHAIVLSNFLGRVSIDDSVSRLTEGRDA